MSTEWLSEITYIYNQNNQRARVRVEASHSALILVSVYETSNPLTSESSPICLLWLPNIGVGVALAALLHATTWHASLSPAHFISV